LKIKNILPASLGFVATALMLTVIQPPVGWSWLAWICLIPFLLVCSPAARLAYLALPAYLVSLVYWLANLYWIAPITTAGWIAFCLYTALLWPGLVVSLRYCRNKRIPLFISAAVLFVGAEQLQGFLLGGFHWRFLAHSQYANLPLIQIADLFGAPAVSMLVAMVNGLLAELIIAADQRKILKLANLLKIALVASVVLAAFSYGRWRIDQAGRSIRTGPVVAGLQSNVPQSVKQSHQACEQIFADLLASSQAAAGAGAELIIWPETMVQAVLDPSVLGVLDARHRYRIFDSALRKHASGTAYLLVGASGGEPEKKDDSTITLVTRYNSAFLYRPDGRQADEKYHKIHLVPFGEVVPFRRSIPWLHSLLMKFTPYDFDYSLDYGTEYTVFDMAAGAGQNRCSYHFGVMICYEDTVPKIARKFTISRQGRKRIHWLVNISNDGWFVRFEDAKISATTELPQHVAACVFRAVENRVAVVRSVNTGISCLIDSTGRVRTGYLAASGNFPIQAMRRKAIAGWFADKVPIDTRTSFYSKYGWLCDYVWPVAFGLLITAALLDKLRKKKGKAGQ